MQAAGVLIVYDIVSRWKSAKTANTANTAKTGSGQSSGPSIGTLVPWRELMTFAIILTPFLAAGGSSLVANWLIVAILLRISDAVRSRPRVVIG